MATRTTAHANTTLFPTGLVAWRFPLVPRPKPPCHPLTQRVNSVSRLARQAGQPTSNAMLHAAEACNLAALVASDCAMPDLARDLCWQQFDAFAAAGPYTQVTAKLALQPLINLARLHIRDGDGDRGYQLLESLLNGIRSRQAQVAIDGRTVNLATVTAPGDDHKTIVQWLWAVLLSDGLRALCRAGHWADALDQAGRHNGIGQRLLDGRQIAILAHIIAGRHEHAEQIIERATITEPWEHAVAACLRAINQPGGDPAGVLAITQAADAYLAIDDSRHAMFLTRLGLTITELSQAHDARETIMDRLQSIATQTADAYIAREILSSPAASLIADETRATLLSTVHQAGLGHPLTLAQEHELKKAMALATATLTQPEGASAHG